MEYRKKFRWLLPVLLCAGILSSCTNLLYYPDHVMYVDEEMMEYKPEDIVLQIPKGLEVHGWYLSSKTPPKGVVVFFHGNGQNRTSHIVDIYWILKEGYDLFAVEYPGYGETDGEPTPENTVQSGRSALLYVHKRKPEVPIIVYGQSLGGAVALRSVIETKKEVPISFVMVHATFLSYEDVGQKILSRAWFTWPFQWLPHLLLSDEFAPGERVSEITPVPLLVMHDKEDPVVPFEMGQAVFDKAKEPKEFWQMADSTHNQPFTGQVGHSMRTKLLLKLDDVLKTRTPTSSNSIKSIKSK